MKKLAVLLMISAALLAQKPGAPSSAGGVKWVVPSRWTADAARPMRVATYKIPAAAGDPEAGECGIYFFGPGQGGTVQANLDRWIGQFETPDGKPAAAGKPQKQTVNGLQVSTIDVSGTYTGAGGPMAASKSSKPGFRLLGAVVEGSQAPIFFKLAGPKKTMAAAEAEFQALVKSIKKE